MEKRGRKPNPDAPEPPAWALAVAAAREREGLTQAAFAEAINVSQQAVGDWERGQTTPRKAAWQRAAARLRIDPAILFEKPRTGFRREIALQPTIKVQSFRSMYASLRQSCVDLGLHIDEDVLAYVAFRLFTRALAADLPEDLRDRLAVLIEDQIAAWEKESRGDIAA